MAVSFLISNDSYIRVYQHIVHVQYIDCTHLGLYRQPKKTIALPLSIVSGMLHAGTVNHNYSQFLYVSNICVHYKSIRLH